MLPVNRYLTMNTFCRSMTYYRKSYSLPLEGLRPLLFENKDSLFSPIVAMTLINLVHNVSHLFFIIISPSFTLIFSSLYISHYTEVNFLHDNFILSWLDKQGRTLHKHEHFCLAYVMWCSLQKCITTNLFS